MPNPPKKIIPNANNRTFFNEIKHRQNCHLIRTGAFTYAMVHLVSRASQSVFIRLQNLSAILCAFAPLH